MNTLRMTSDLRRQLILGAAKRCFARNGFAGTTTKSVAAAAAISEALLFKHFPSKAALYAEILAEECEADPELAHLLGLAPSTAALVELMQGMVRHFVHGSDSPDQEEEEQRLRLMVTSHLEDGEFARLLYAKVDKLIGPMFTASLEAAIAAGDAVHSGLPINLFWFAHHTVMTAALTRLPAAHCLAYGNSNADLERQLCEFLLRGIGLTEAAIAAHLTRELSRAPIPPVVAESA